MKALPFHLFASLLCLIAARPLAGSDPGENLKRAESAYLVARNRALQGNQGEAVEAYRRIVKLHRNTPYAPKAQFEIATLLSANREYQEAFDAYQLLIDKFPASDLFLQCLEGQYKIAQRVIHLYKQRERLQDKSIRLPDRESVSAMLKTILANGRHSSFAADAQYQLAVFLNREGKQEESVMEFYQLLKEYPESRLADDAAFQIAYVDYRQAKLANRERGASGRARLAFEYFIGAYPSSEKVPEAAHLLAVLGQWEQRAYGDAARLYEKTGRTEAAVKSYEKAVEVSDGENTGAMRKRLENLKSGSGSSNTEVLLPPPVILIERKPETGS